MNPLTSLYQIYRIGLDIGTSSVGFAVIGLNSDTKEGHIMDRGVIWFDAAV
jgi:CRISPR/Cas system Type II protein with McrA/HNH and RuvC-like nuclease domain